MTKITLYNGISLDGYIAKSDGDSSWVLDADNFEKVAQEKQVIIMGRTTYDREYGTSLPMKDVLNVVVTSEVGMVIHDVNVKPVNTVNQAFEYLNSHQIKEALLIGGGKVNTSFLKENKIDELMISVHPLILGKGIKLFEDIELEKSLTLLDITTLDNNVVLLRYSVIQ